MEELLDSRLICEINEILHLMQQINIKPEYHRYIKYAYEYTGTDTKILNRLNNNNCYAQDCNGCHYLMAGDAQAMIEMLYFDLLPKTKG